MGRLSNLELAARVGLPPSACLRRVQELERQGVIRGYRAVPDPARLGRGFVGYLTVGRKSPTKASHEAFERSVNLAPQVRDRHTITGTVEYLSRIEVADLKAYKYFHTEVIGTLPMVQALTTFVVPGSPKDERA